VKYSQEPSTFPFLFVVKLLAASSLFPVSLAFSPGPLPKEGTPCELQVGATPFLSPRYSCADCLIRISFFRAFPGGASFLPTSKSHPKSLFFNTTFKASPGFFLRSGGLLFLIVLRYLFFGLLVPRRVWLFVHNEPFPISPSQSFSGLITTPPTLIRLSPFLSLRLTHPPFW